jgi:hypothetical protein
LSGLVVGAVGEQRRGTWSTRRQAVDGLKAGFALNHLLPTVLAEALLEALTAGHPAGS